MSDENDIDLLFPVENIVELEIVTVENNEVMDAMGTLEVMHSGVRSAMEELDTVVDAILSGNEKEFLEVVKSIHDLRNALDSMQLHAAYGVKLRRKKE